MTNSAATPSAISQTTRRSILLLSFATFSSTTAQRICDAMLPELSRVFAVGLAQAAQTVSAFAVVYGVAQLVYGPLGDRLGKFRVVTFATLGCSVGSVLATMAPSLDLLVLARVLMAMGAAAIIPLTLAWIGDSVPADQLQESLARAGLGTTLGILGGQMVGGVMTDTIGWRWAFVFMTVLYLAVGSFLYADLRRQAVALKAAPKPPAEPAALAKGGPRPGFVAQAIIILTGRWSRIVLMVSFVEGAVGFGVLAIWASHLHAALSLPLAYAGTVVALFGLGGMLYMAVARSLVRRLGQKGLAVVGVCLSGSCAVVLAYTPWWALAVPASLLAGFGFFMFHNTMQTNATMMAPTARGTGVGLFAAALFMGQSVGVLVAAGLIGALGSAAVIALGGCVLAAAGCFFAYAMRWRDLWASQPI